MNLKWENCAEICCFEMHVKKSGVLFLMSSLLATCRPCSDEEVLMAVCTSDFGKYCTYTCTSIYIHLKSLILPVHSLILSLSPLFLSRILPVSIVGRGTIQSVENKPSPPTSGTNDRSLVAVILSRLFNQKSGVFASGGARGRRWMGRVNVPVQCGVRAGGDEYLFTGSIHFGEAWLGCAPRYKDFEKLYVAAQEAGTNPCQIDTD